MRCVIYGLVDPRELRVLRYVGKTVQPYVRLRKHCTIPKSDRHTWRGKWLAKLRAEGLTPALVVLLSVQVEHASEAEREMIRRMRAAGHPLTNGSSGGDGGALHPEIQALVNAKVKAAFAAGLRSPPTMTPEQKEQMRAKLSALRSDPRFNPMKRPDVIAKNKTTNAERLRREGRVKAKPLTKRGTPEWYESQRDRARKAVSALASRPSPLLGKPKSQAHRDALRAAADAKSTLLLKGKVTTVREVAALAGVSPKTIREFARRKRVSLQEAIDHYASRLNSLPDEDAGPRRGVNPA